MQPNTQTHKLDSPILYFKQLHFHPQNFFVGFTIIVSCEGLITYEEKPIRKKRMSSPVFVICRIENGSFTMSSTLPCPFPCFIRYWIFSLAVEKLCTCPARQWRQILSVYTGTSMLNVSAVTPGMHFLLFFVCWLYIINGFQKKNLEFSGGKQNLETSPYVTPCRREDWSSKSVPVLTLPTSKTCNEASIANTKSQYKSPGEKGRLKLSKGRVIVQSIPKCLSLTLSI